MRGEIYLGGKMSAISISFPLVYEGLIKKVQFRRPIKRKKDLEKGARATDKREQ